MVASAQPAGKCRHNSDGQPAEPDVAVTFMLL